MYIISMHKSKLDYIKYEIEQLYMQRQILVFSFV